MWPHAMGLDARRPRIGMGDMAVCVSVTTVTLKTNKANLLTRGVAGVLASMLLSGCVLAPKEAGEERQRVRSAGVAYEAPAEQRVVPNLPPAPSWEDVLRRALLANGELEAAYFEWVGAVHRIEQAGSYPNTPVSLGFSYMFSGERMKSFDRTTITAGPDPMESLAFPPKVYQAGKVALDDARAAGQRFVAAKFKLQREVLNAWYDYALMAERVRIAEGNLSLLRLINQTAAGRVRAGGAQQDMLRTEIELRRAEDELLGMQARLPQMRAMLNAKLGRLPDADLQPPAAIPVPRELRAGDERLLSLASEVHPELAPLVERVQGRKDAIELARLQYIPDLNPTFGFTGTASQVVGLALSIPTFLPKVHGMVEEARAGLRAAEAELRQMRFDHAAEVVATLWAMRNSERQAKLFEEQIVPTSQRVVENAREAYTRGTASFVDLIDTQRTLLEVRLTAAEARVAREKALADLEALLGVDVETLAARAAATQPTTVPTTQPIQSVTP
jgi:outer membrane protein TolC